MPCQGGQGSEVALGVWALLIRKLHIALGFGQLLDSLIVLKAQKSYAWTLPFLSP